jgi:hypothetical protein
MTFNVYSGSRITSTRLHSSRSGERENGEVGSSLASKWSPATLALLADGVACIARRRGDGNDGLIWTGADAQS